MNKIWTEDQKQNGFSWLDRGGFSKAEWINKIAGMESHVKGVK